MGPLRLGDVSAFPYPETAAVLLGLGLRPVGDEHLAVGLLAQRLCIGGRVMPQANFLTPAAIISRGSMAGTSRSISLSISATNGFAGLICRPDNISTSSLSMATG